MTGVYVQTNEPDGNRVLAFARRGDGSLESLGAFATGGRGDGVPHLTSQGSVVVSGDGSRLYVTNAGSGDVSVFAIADGLELLETIPTGTAPKSVAEHAGTVAVLNTGDRTLTLLPEQATVELPAADPAQVGFSPDGATIVVTDRGTDAIGTIANGLSKSTSYLAAVENEVAAGTLDDWLGRDKIELVTLLATLMLAGVIPEKWGDRIEQLVVDGERTSTVHLYSAVLEADIEND
jgi:DNA-binding beta-propeller fold protein YncE